MQMKKALFWGSAILCCALMFVGISCADTESGTIGVDVNLVDNGITVGENGQVVRLQVICNGDWRASVPEDCDWVNVIVSKGNGNGKVVFTVDGQYEGIARSTILTIVAGSTTVKVKIQQNVSGENDGEYKYYSSKGLGCGFNPNTLKKTTASVLNFCAIEELAKVDSRHFGDVYYLGDVDKSNAGISMSDSIEHKYDSLCVRLSLEISYANFKFGMSGAIDIHDNRINSVKTEHFNATYPVYQGNLRYAALASAYRDWVEEGMPQKNAEGKEDLRGAVLSSSFSKAVVQLDELAKSASTYKGNSAIESCCKTVVGTWSPLVLTDVILGGAYCVEVEYDPALMDVEDGEVSESLSSGLFEVGGVDVDSQKAKNWLEHSNFKVLIQGGEEAKCNALYNEFVALNFGEASYSTALKEWSRSLKIDEKTGRGNVELVRYSVVPIWLFFSDKAQTILREYIMDQEAYKTNELIIASDF